MNQSTPYSDFFLNDLGPGTGLGILGFRAAAFGRTECRCIAATFGSALGAESGSALDDFRALAQSLGKEGNRKISLAAPGCGRVTKDELSLACAMAAAQAWDRGALEAHLAWLRAGRVPRTLQELVIRIADTFAGHGFAFDTPRAQRATIAGTTPAFRVVGGFGR